MAWKLGTVSLYVDKNVANRNNIIARLQPVNNNTLYHVFGYEDRTYAVNAMVVTDDDITTLDGYAKGLTSSVVFSGPEGVIGDVRVKKFTADRTNAVNTVIFDRPALPVTMPVYAVTLELYRDE